MSISSKGYKKKISAPYKKRSEFSPGLGSTLKSRSISCSEYAVDGNFQLNDSYESSESQNLLQSEDIINNNTLTILCLSFSIIDLSNFRKDVLEATTVISKPNTSTSPLYQSTTADIDKTAAISLSDCFYESITNDSGLWSNSYGHLRRDQIASRIRLKFHTVDQLVNRMYEVDFEFHGIILLVNYLHPFLKAQLNSAIGQFLDGGFFDLSIPLVLLSLDPQQDCTPFCKSIRSEFSFGEDNLCYYRYSSPTAQLRQKQRNMSESDQNEEDEKEKEPKQTTLPTQNSMSKQYKVIHDVFNCLERRAVDNLDLSNWHLLKY
ncbi:uncharacterized protein LOC142351174 [Convolutriloba macropyga]|uniref:uncharacterized protein LOC142351174 n=1 Tax=Convolutriloba macropyga TaxID=536237 RepID=UPI003F528686